MKIVRFIDNLLVPFLTPLLLLPLLIAWIILSIILYIWDAWDKACKGG